MARIEVQHPDAGLIDVAQIVVAEQALRLDMLDAVSRREAVELVDDRLMARQIFRHRLADRRGGPPRAAGQGQLRRRIEPVDRDRIDDDGRLARLLQVEGCADEILTAGQRWALADLAANIGNPQERETVHAIAGMIGPTRRLPRALRPLTVLDGLARRSLAAGAGAPLLHGPLSGLAAMRLGLFGR